MSPNFRGLAASERRNRAEAETRSRRMRGWGDMFGFGFCCLSSSRFVGTMLRSGLAADERRGETEGEGGNRAGGEANGLRPLVEEERVSSARKIAKRFGS